MDTYLDFVKLSHRFSQSVTETVGYIKSLLSRGKPKIIQHNDLQAGLKIIADIRNLLKKVDLKFKRDYHQVHIHEKILSAACETLFRDSFEANKTYIYEQTGLDPTIVRGVSFTAPRQSGKTTTIVLILCAFLICIPNADIMVISHRQNASGKDRGIGGKIGEFLPKYFGFTNFTLKDEIIECNMGSGDRRKIILASSLSGEGLVIRYVIYINIIV